MIDLYVGELGHVLCSDGRTLHYMAGVCRNILEWTGFVILVTAIAHRCIKSSTQPFFLIFSAVGSFWAPAWQCPCAHRETDKEVIYCVSETLSGLHNPGIYCNKSSHPCSDIKWKYIPDFWWFNRKIHIHIWVWCVYILLAVYVL